MGKAIASGLLKPYAIGNVKCVGAIAIVALWAWHCGRHIPNMMPDCCLRTASSCEFVKRGQIPPNFLMRGMRMGHCAAVANGLSLEDTLKVATAEAYSGYKLYPWTHKQMNVRTPTDG